MLFRYFGRQRERGPGGKHLKTSNRSPPPGPDIAALALTAFVVVTRTPLLLGEHP